MWALFHMSGFTVEEVQQLHLVVIRVNFSRTCILFIVLWVEMCFQTFDMNTFRFFKEARSWWRCLQPAESGGPWSSLWVQTHPLRKTVEVELLNLHFYPRFNLKALQKPLNLSKLLCRGIRFHQSTRWTHLWGHTGGIFFIEPFFLLSWKNAWIIFILFPVIWTITVFFGL